jgi:4-hydroxy 2-oxovalerate aldolase
MEFNSRPVVLDVTLRDGGYLNNWQFTEPQIGMAIQTATRCGADIIEVGYIDDRDGLPVAASWKPEDLENIRSTIGSPKLAVMCRPSVENAVNVVKKRRTLIDLVRIPTDLRNPSLANKIADICLALNVPCTFNITNISCYSDDHIYRAFKQLSDQVPVVYIADSRGALQPKRVQEIFTVLQSVRTCIWGYHAHNNLGLAEATTKAALDFGVEFIDGSILGIGLGGRNLDLNAALKLASIFRPELLAQITDYGVNELTLGVYPPGEELELYRLTGIKNFKMEWAMMMHECLGLEQACALVNQAPDYPMFNPDEFKSYVTETTWRKLRW